MRSIDISQHTYELVIKVCNWHELGVDQAIAFALSALLDEAE